MSEFDGEIEQLGQICPGAKLMTEGGLAFAFLPQLKFPSRGSRVKMDALLAPQGHSGYQTRLFLDQPLAGVGVPWYAQQILGRTWHAISWQGVTPAQSWARILAQHLRPLA